MVAEKPSIAIAIARILSKGQVREHRMRLNLAEFTFPWHVFLILSERTHLRHMLRALWRDFVGQTFLLRFSPCIATNPLSSPFSVLLTMPVPNFKR